MAKMWKKDDLWSGDPTYINTVDLLFKGWLRGFWRYRSALIVPRGFLHWCKLDSAFYRWNFFNEPEIMWNDVRGLWDSLMRPRRCCFNILKTSKLLIWSENTHVNF
jgi:hypothetical protein